MCIFFSYIIWCLVYGKQQPLNNFRWKLLNTYKYIFYKTNYISVAQLMCETCIYNKSEIRHARRPIQRPIFGSEEAHLTLHNPSTKTTHQAFRYIHFARASSLAAPANYWELGAGLVHKLINKRLQLDSSEPSSPAGLRHQLFTNSRSNNEMESWSFKFDLT